MSSGAPQEEKRAKPLTVMASVQYGQPELKIRAEPAVKEGGLITFSAEGHSIPVAAFVVANVFGHNGPIPKGEKVMFPSGDLNSVLVNGKNPREARIAAARETGRMEALHKGGLVTQDGETWKIASGVLKGEAYGAPRARAGKANDEARKAAKALHDAKFESRPVRMRPKFAWSKNPREFLQKEDAQFYALCENYLHEHDVESKVVKEFPDNHVTMIGPGRPQPMLAGDHEGMKITHVLKELADRFQSMALGLETKGADGALADALKAAKARIADLEREVAASRPTELARQLAELGDENSRLRSQVTSLEAEVQELHNSLPEEGEEMI